MSISSFSPQEVPAPIERVFKKLFENRIHKKISIDKSDFADLPSLQLHGRKEYPQITKRSSYFSFYQEEDKILSYHSVNPEPCIKKKMIKKAVIKRRDLESAKEIN